MTKKVAFITGGSKGIGLSFCRELVKHNFQVINFSRTEPDFNHSKLITYKTDLIDLNSSISLFDSVLSEQNWDSIDEAILINNAGVLAPMYLMGSKIENHAIKNHFSINTIIPMEFSSRFIFATREFKRKKMILNVGSGAANQPIEGWSIYGASKAALHYFTQTVAIEQKRSNNPCIVSLFDPGRTDTDMQLQIRTSSTVEFPLAQSFKEAYESGKLNNPNTLAQKVVAKINSNSIQQGDQISHRDL